jgi:ribonuclease R
MQDKLGEKFDGTITSVNSFGLFVELDAVHVNGLVHITALDNDYYHFDPIGYRLHGERTGMIYRLGDRLRVQVAAVNLDDRKIDFVPIAAPGAAKRKPAPPKAIDAPATRQPQHSDRRKPPVAAHKPTKPEAAKDAAPASKKKSRSRRRKRKPNGKPPTASE